ncbi:MAG: UrcA family protein [Bacillota bacterium]
MKKGFLITLVSALATAAVIKAAPALAEPAQQNVAVVHTSDLDLSSSIGRAELEHRLVRAAYEVCGTASDADLAGRNQVRACRANVLASAHARTQELAAGGRTIAVSASR